MKSFYTFILLLLFQQTSFSQLAQSYFPTQPGFKWTYRATPLDSLNNPVNSLVYYQIDSFAVVQNYQGRSASYVLSKSGTEITVPYLPYLDTSYLSFQNNDAYKYYKLFNFGLPFRKIQNNNFSLKNPYSVNDIQAFEGWFAYYKFAAAVNLNYSVFSKDTSLSIDTLTFPIRYELKGRRLADQSITTALGNFNCKKFLLTTVVSYLPLPILPIPLYQLIDTSWIASGNWIVKQVLPSSKINLSAIGLSTFVLPGTMKEIIPPLVTKIENEEILSKKFYLYQNYPNPFNPSTKISYSIPLLEGNKRGGFVTLKVYDVLGNEVATLVNDYKPAGSYEVEFQSAVGNKQLASGIYYYQLRIGDFIQTEKMLLVR
jgi:hypothetical protein